MVHGIWMEAVAVEALLLSLPPPPPDVALRSPPRGPLIRLDDDIGAALRFFPLQFQSLISHLFSSTQTTTTKKALA